MNNGLSIKERVITLISNVIERPIGEDDLHKHFIEEWGIDSLLALEILAVMEKEFGVEIPEEELGNFVTVANVIDVAERKVAELATA